MEEGAAGGGVEGSWTDLDVLLAPTMYSVLTGALVGLIAVVWFDKIFWPLQAWPVTRFWSFWEVPPRPQAAACGPN